MADLNINGLVNGLFAKYDHNQNGTIELKRQGFLGLKDERDRTDVGVGTGFQKDAVSISTASYTARDLLYSADKNGDKVVTRDELLAEIKKFDKDGDGVLKQRSFGQWITGKAKTEYDSFIDTYGRNGERSAGASYNEIGGSAK